MDSHELVVALKQLALELGRVPTRSELESSLRGGKHWLTRLFGTYAALLQAAGMETYDERRAPKKTRITDAIFHKDLEQHLERVQTKDKPASTPWPRIAILGDLHEPFSHAGVKQAFVAFVAETQPEYVIQVGDCVDAYSHGKFPRSHNVFTPKQEEELARKNLEDFWAAIRKAAPNAKCIMLLGNHAVRPLKRVLESVPSIEHWAEKYLEELLSFEGVETIMDPREEYMIADIAFIHGFRGGQGVHRDFLMRNTVLGHLHTGNVSFRNYRDETLFELNAGYAADPFSKGLTYTPTKTTGWTLGWGAIDERGPRFIPYRKTS